MQWLKYTLQEKEVRLMTNKEQKINTYYMKVLGFKHAHFVLCKGKNFAFPHSPCACSLCVFWLPNV
jgi:hypothetical protein